MASTELWAGIGSVLAFILALISMALHHERITLWMNTIKAFFSPYIQITIPEYDAEHLERSDFYVAIEAYLSKKCAADVRKLKAELGSHRKKPLFYVDDGQQIIDTFRGGEHGDGGGGGEPSSGCSGGEPGGGGSEQPSSTSTSTTDSRSLTPSAAASIIDTFRGGEHGDGRGGGEPSGGCSGGEPGGGGSEPGGCGGGTVWWHAYKEKPTGNVIVFRPGEEERRFYRVSFHRRIRKSVLKEYLPHVIQQGRKVIDDNRQRRLFTNNPFPNSGWSHVAFQHPATFNKLAMDSTLKQTIIKDLDTFKNRMDYYLRVGKPWKRGYLLFGPPGTGKSTMIAAMANHLKYDVYDLELTAVKSNNELRRLFIQTKGKSIIVIEDIDCSVDLTGKRRVKEKRGHKKPAAGEVVVANMTAAAEQAMIEARKANEDDGSQLTLSGVLNFIDGLWSACGGERIIVFTTNNKDRLDPALIRRGRMDMHIEMSYCSYEAFTMLVNNYLEIDENQLFEQFGKIQQLLEVTKMSTADVAEHLMRKENDAGACLDALVVALEEKKQADEEAARNELQKSKENKQAVEDQ